LEIIDIDLNCGRWPFNRYASCAMASLKRKAKALEIEKGFITPFSAFFEDENLQPNKLFLSKMRARGNKFLPVMTVNPEILTCDEILETADERGLPIKFLNRFHDWSLLSPSCRRFLSKIEEKGLPVIIQPRIFDERTAPGLLKTLPDVNVNEFVKTARYFPGTNFVLSCLTNGEALSALEKNPGNIYITSSFLEGEEFLENIFSEFSDRIMSGSNFPLFYMEAAAAKIESSGVSEKKKYAIAAGNALKVFSRCL
jgi:predicted TIM-barrel fold metal-dependent hydrolase